MATQLAPKLEMRSVEKLIPYARNARTHTDEQVAQIAASIQEFGWTNPILIDEKNTIIAGHGRVLAARKLGLEEIPAIILSGLTEAQKRALVIADNQLALNAGWNLDLLSVELQELQLADFNLDILGFDEKELNRILDQNTSTGGDADACPKVEEKVISKPGDLWILGESKVLCGDSTNVLDLQKLLGSEKADLLFTDPPYGMSYGGGRARGDHVMDKKTGGVRIKAHGKIEGDDLRGEELEDLIRSAIGNAKLVSKAGAGAYICLTWRTYAIFLTALKNIGYEVKNCIVWDKQSIGLGYSDYRPQHEFIFYCPGQWYGQKNEPDVWNLSRGNTGEYVHPTQKPVELVERALKNSTKRGDLILDVFGGSGSTLIAAESTERKAYLVELDAKYVDVIVRRWQNYTKNDAYLATTKQSFAEVEQNAT